MRAQSYECVCLYPPDFNNGGFRYCQIFKTYHKEFESPSESSHHPPSHRITQILKCEKHLLKIMEGWRIDNNSRWLTNVRKKK